MWAILRVISYSLESTINKRLLNKKNVIYYLANKYWMALPLLAVIYFLDTPVLQSQGIWLLALICVLLALTQLISFHGLARISASTNIVVKQSKLLMMLLISLILGQVSGWASVLSVVIVFVGGVLITKKEVKESSNKKDTFTGVFLAVFVTAISIALSFLMKYGFSQNYFSTGIYSISAIVTIVILFNIMHYTNPKSVNSQKKSFDKKEIYLLQLTGVLSVVVNITNALAIDVMGVFLTELISATAPILVLLFAVLSKQEKWTLLRVTGVLLTAVGTVLAVIF